MLALLLITAFVAIVAGSFALVVHQIAKARRRQYLEEAALNNLGCATTAEVERKASRRMAADIRALLAAHKAAKHAPLRRHPHSPMLAR